MSQKHKIFIFNCFPNFASLPLFIFGLLFKRFSFGQCVINQSRISQNFVFIPGIYVQLSRKNLRGGGGWVNSH